MIEHDATRGEVLFEKFYVVAIQRFTAYMDQTKMGEIIFFTKCLNESPKGGR
jgi:hypothetical protein